MITTSDTTHFLLFHHSFSSTIGVGLPIISCVLPVDASRVQNILSNELWLIKDIIEHGALLTL